MPRITKKTRETATKGSTLEQEAPGGAAEGTDPGSKPSSSTDAFKNLADTTSRVVQQAASILEEEIAAGIVAARQIEQRFIDVESVRSGKPEDVIHRFRRDAHEVVDILVDLVGAAARSLGDVASRVITVRTGARTAAAESNNPGGVATICTPQPVKPGESSEAPMMIENEGSTPTAVISFHCSDLVSAAGDRIAAKNISFRPAAVSVSPRQTEKIAVSVAVPAGTPAGSFSGLLQATNLDQLRAVLVVQVEPGPV